MALINIKYRNNQNLEIAQPIINYHNSEQTSNEE